MKNQDLEENIKKKGKESKEKIESKTGLKALKSFWEIKTLKLATPPPHPLPPGKINLKGRGNGNVNQRELSGWGMRDGQQFEKHNKYSCNQFILMFFMLQSWSALCSVPRRAAAPPAPSSPHISALVCTRFPG